MNTYKKYCPNVYVACCKEKHEKGDVIIVTTRRGKENECIVHNLVGQTNDGKYLYSITRKDGFNLQERAKRRASRLNSAALNAMDKSNERWEASKEGRDFLSLGEPIKVGHHSEKRHRALIQRNNDRMAKSVEYSDKSKDYAARAEYWESRTEDINLSMPESIEYFEIKLQEAIIYHQGLKDGTIERPHSLAMQYANKAVKDLRKKVDIAQKLWGDHQ
jgi:hypothetical protein